MIFLHFLYLRGRRIPVFSVRRKSRARIWDAVKAELALQAVGERQSAQQKTRRAA
jgi:hypothetical protein